MFEICSLFILASISGVCVCVCVCVCVLCVCVCCVEVCMRVNIMYSINLLINTFVFSSRLFS
jgi:hypothetical protein